MSKKAITAFLFLLVISLGAAVAEDQVVLLKDLKTWDREEVAGGVGTLSGQYSLTRHDALDDFAIKEIGWMTLLPGHSIGLHKHENNEDAYIIISGEGTFTDSDGKQTVVRGGDVTIARKGQSHALANTGRVPLIFLDIVGQQ